MSQIVMNCGTSQNFLRISNNMGKLFLNTLSYVSLVNFSQNQIPLKDISSTKSTYTLAPEKKQANNDIIPRNSVMLDVLTTNSSATFETPYRTAPQITKISPSISL